VFHPAQDEFMNDNHNLQFSQMLDWLEGRLSEEDGIRVAQKLETANEATFADLNWLRSFLEISETAYTLSPPPDVRANLREQFRAYSQSKQPPSLFRRLLATLTFDSSTQFSVVGVRSAKTKGKQRQLVYNSDLAEIALNVQPRPRGEQITLIGQVFPQGDLSPEGLCIQLVDADGISEKGFAISDELGEFTIESFPQGWYGIYLTTAGVEIVLLDVPLRNT
jgi:hypothetical protein